MTQRRYDNTLIAARHSANVRELQAVLDGDDVRALQRVLDLHGAVIEWRDARQAIFDQPTAEPALWARLADAEHALMAIAKRMRS
jgi:hypothetical protein